MYKRQAHQQLLHQGALTVARSRMDNQAGGLEMCIRDRIRMAFVQINNAERSRRAGGD